MPPVRLGADRLVAVGGVALGDLLEVVDGGDRVPLAERVGEHDLGDGGDHQCPVRQVAQVAVQDVGVRRSVGVPSADVHDAGSVELVLADLGVLADGGGHGLGEDRGVGAPGALVGPSGQRAERVGGVHDHGLPQAGGGLAGDQGVERSLPARAQACSRAAPNSARSPSASIRRAWSSRAASHSGTSSWSRGKRSSSWAYTSGLTPAGSSGSVSWLYSMLSWRERWTEMIMESQVPLPGW
ncbi:hypothetical protein [Nocardiopsis sp. FR26]|uniref:hypothetical protein n=1 Tax=Nocardiopsis sp. FR26 TaxID=2605987 RepID=UPI001F2924B7|nr:hypothetical protein [Nocardiopsis sp. FR26]